MANERLILSKFPGKCTACGFRFPEQTPILFNTYKRTARHVKCPEISYDGAEQVGIFQTWVQRAQEAEK